MKTRSTPSPHLTILQPLSVSLRQALSSGLRLAREDGAYTKGAGRDATRARRAALVARGLGVERGVGDWHLISDRMTAAAASGSIIHRARGQVCRRQRVQPSLLSSSSSSSCRLSLCSAASPVPYVRASARARAPRKLAGFAPETLWPFSRRCGIIT